MRFDMRFYLLGCMNVAGLQLQSASTESFFMLPGHGSPPKTSGATDTEQDCFPMQFCKRLL